MSVGGRGSSRIRGDAPAGGAQHLNNEDVAVVLSASDLAAERDARSGKARAAPDPEPEHEVVHQDHGGLVGQCYLWGRYSTGRKGLFRAFQPLAMTV